MKITILSKAHLYRMMEKNALPKNTAIVSFADEEDEFLDFPKGTDVFKVVFYDIRPYDE